MEIFMFYLDLLKRAGFPLLLFAYGVLLFAFPGYGMLWLACFAFTGILLERFLPYHKSWSGPGRDTKLDLAYSAVSILAGTALASGITMISAAASLTGGFWPEHWPLALRVVLALGISGFFPYWLHRFAHETSRTLWDIHAVHHAPVRVYSLNALRAHPLNAAWNTAAGLLPLVLIGADGETILLAGGLNNFFSLFNHMNIDFKNPLLSTVFNTAELHRWHHSSEPSLGNSNYSSGALAIWDHAFGTWILPRERIAADGAGLYGEFANSYPRFRFMGQLLYPFCRCA